MHVLAGHWLLFVQGIPVQTIRPGDVRQRHSQPTLSVVLFGVFVTLDCVLMFLLITTNQSVYFV